MGEMLFYRPAIAVNDFLPIFISASMILIFGVLYASTITLVKMNKIKNYYNFIAYFFWLLQIYSTYFLTVKIHSQPFTTKAMIIVMIAYLMVPHIYFYLISQSDKRYINSKKEE